MCRYKTIRLLLALFVIACFADPLSAQKNRWEEQFRRAGQLELENPAEAESAYLVALEEAENNDRRLLSTLSRLARLYRIQKRYADEEPLLKRQLAIREKATGPNDHWVAEDRIHLAEVYVFQGEYEQAALQLRQALEFFDQANDWRTLGLSSNLISFARLYRDHGRAMESEALLRRITRIRERHLDLVAEEHGPQNPIVAGSLSTLARLYVDTGRPKQGEDAYLRSIETYRKALESYPEAAMYYASALEGLAGLYRSQGREVEAEPLLTRASALRSIVLDFEFEDLEVEP